MKRITLQVAGKIKCSSVNGSGLRYVLFLSGCVHKCKGCHSPHTWDSRYGTKEDVVDIFNDIYKNRKYIDGVTISGGEPLLQESSLRVLLEMLKLFGINIWLWTGYELKDLRGHNNFKDYFNVIIDGKFEVDNPTEKPYRGSDNQIMWVKDGRNMWHKESKEGEYEDDVNN